MQFWRRNSLIVALLDPLRDRLLKRRAAMKKNRAMNPAFPLCDDLQTLELSTYRSRSRLSRAW
jgi:hypothetical protein